jgi:hypothetical protein
MAQSQSVQEKPPDVVPNKTDDFLEENEIPEVFNLPPLARKPIVATVRTTRPAPFYYGLENGDVRCKNL